MVATRVEPKAESSERQRAAVTAASKADLSVWSSAGTLVLWMAGSRAEYSVGHWAGSSAAGMAVHWGSRMVDPKAGMTELWLVAPKAVHSAVSKAETLASVRAARRAERTGSDSVVRWADEMVARSADLLAPRLASARVDRWAGSSAGLMDGATAEWRAERRAVPRVVRTELPQVAPKVGTKVVLWVAPKAVRSDFLMAGL